MRHSAGRVPAHSLLAMAFLPRGPRVSISLSTARGFAWRWRHAFLAVAIAAGGLTLADAIAIRGGAPCVVLQSQLPAGHRLTARDVAVVDFSPAVDGGFESPNAVIGQPLAVGLPAGTPLTPGMLVGPGLADSAPPGTTVLTVQLADPGSIALARPGARVSLVGDTEWAAGVLLASDVVVLAQLTATQSSLLESKPDSAYALVAVPPGATNVVLQASALAPLRIALE